jgi:hypothetical protein
LSRATFRANCQHERARQERKQQQQQQRQLPQKWVAGRWQQQRGALPGSVSERKPERVDQRHRHHLQLEAEQGVQRQRRGPHQQETPQGAFAQDLLSSGCRFVVSMCPGANVIVLLRS